MFVSEKKKETTPGDEFCFSKLFESQGAFPFSLVRHYSITAFRQRSLTTVAVLF